MFLPVPVITWDGFLHFFSLHIFPGPNSDPYILTPLYFILSSRNLFQSIPVPDLVCKVYHIDRFISNRSGVIAA